MLIVLGVALALAIILAVGRGAVPLSPGEVIAVLGQRLGLSLGDVGPQQAAILWSVRLPRVLLAVLVGAALAGSGVALQGVARNPIADPALIGISGGAALGAVIAFTAGGALLDRDDIGRWVVPACAFVGAWISTTVAVAIARVDGRMSGVTLLLAGIGLAALTGAGYGAMLYFADDAALRSITFWSLGSLGGASWSVLALAGPPIVLGLVVLPRFAPALDRIALGEAEARHVGVDVDRVIRLVIALAALAVGAAVAMCGVIGFVGLVVPYVARALVGPGHRALLPACFLGGGLLLVLADLAARTVVAPTELPIGVVTAFVGAPVLLALVRRGRGGDLVP